MTSSLLTGTVSASDSGENNTARRVLVLVRFSAIESEADIRGIVCTGPFPLTIANRCLLVAQHRQQ